MINYIIRRLLLFIPTLIIISLLAFIISINAPGDPVERMISSSDDGATTQSANQILQKKYWRNKLGIDLPVFYFSISSLSEPQNLNSKYDKNEVNSILRLANISGNKNNTLNYSIAKNKLINAITRSQKFRSDSIFQVIQPDLAALKYAYTFEEINFRLNKIQSHLENDNEIASTIAEANNAFLKLKSETTYWKNYIPVLHFHPYNQYHRWMFGDGYAQADGKTQFTKGIIRGDFGMSYQTRQPVSEVISEKIGWSLLLSALSIILAYAISIPLGVWAGANQHSHFDKNSSLIVFALYSMPAFWVATILLMIFANPDVLHWFPASGVKPPAGYSDSSNLAEKIKLTLPYLILPIICYTYSSFAFISRTIRVSMIDNMHQDYIRTAKAKGVAFNSIVFKHAFRNSLLPLITIFANIFPMAIGGSVIIETIFSIPGMGYETVQAIYNQNYPMIVAVFTISGLLTVSGYLLSDILYAVADPRIKFVDNTK